MSWEREHVISEQQEVSTNRLINKSINLTVTKKEPLIGPSRLRSPQSLHIFYIEYYLFSVIPFQWNTF